MGRSASSSAISQESSRRADSLARLAKYGMAGGEELNELAGLVYEMVRPSAMRAVGDGRLRFADVDDVCQNVAIKFFQRIQTWDKARGCVSTFVGVIFRSCCADMQRGYLEETIMQQRLGGSYVDLERVVACAAIASDPDALYEWDEQIGRWMCDNVQVDAGDLAKLRNHLLKKYELKELFNQTRGKRQ